MSVLESFKPQFWSQAPERLPFGGRFNYRRAWLAVVLAMMVVALTPLTITVVIDDQVTKRGVESEMRLRKSRVVSNAKRSLYYYLDESISALELIAGENGYDDLTREGRLEKVLDNLRNSFSGFTDLGVIDPNGLQRHYIGPYNLKDKDYSGQDDFNEAISRGVYVSDVFRGFRNTPHFVIIVRKDVPGEGFFLLRATLDTQKFNDLAKPELTSQGDSFIVNHHGVLQTPSQYYGHVLNSIDIPSPPFSEHTEVIDEKSPDGRVLMVAYAYIPDSPFILMVVVPKNMLFESWKKTRMELFLFFLLSASAIILVVFGLSTYLVNRIYLADMKNVAVLRQAEQANKMASIGNLAAGVAHEINNPLAIISENAGLIKDIFTYSEEYKADERLLRRIDSVLRSVERCGTITKRLLNFARHLDFKIERFSLTKAIEEVLGFLAKEAEYRAIQVVVDVHPEIQEIVSDRGMVQQIFLNLVNNAFAAMSDGGKLEIRARMQPGNRVVIFVEDNGSGIPEKDLGHIWEPFFSTKKDSGGTGLGLSIISGLVKKLGGNIEVESVLGEGTAFIIVLPTRFSG